jgi:hypothetical protein
MPKRSTVPAPHLVPSPEEKDTAAMRVIDAAESARYRLNVVLELMDYYFSGDVGRPPLGSVEDTGGEENIVIENLITGVRDSLSTALAAHEAVIEADLNAKAGAQ